jgi:hypothetical protein
MRKVLLPCLVAILLSSCAHAKPPPPRQMLRNMAVAYGKVRTLKVTRETTVVVDGRPLTTPPSTYYFERPDKERVDNGGRQIAITNGAYTYLRNLGEKHWTRRLLPKSAAARPRDPSPLYVVRRFFSKAKRIGPVRSGKTDGVECWLIDFDTPDGHVTTWIGKNDWFVHRADQTDSIHACGKQQAPDFTFIERDIQVDVKLPAGWFAPPSGAKIINDGAGK